MKKLILGISILIILTTIMGATGVLTYLYKPANPQSELNSVYIDTDGSLKSTDGTDIFLYPATNLSTNSITALDSTPSILGGGYYTMPSATGTFLTDLDDAYHGQIVYIMGSSVDGTIDMTGADKVYKKQGLKFHLITDYFVDNPKDLDKYERFIFLDDDILMQSEDIEKLFEIAKEYDLRLFHPSILPKNYWHEMMFKIPNLLVHTQNWCETQSIGMERNTLKLLIGTFKVNKSGYGLPNLWCNILGEQIYNIIDAVDSIHTRPLASGKDSCYNKFGGLDEAMNEYYSVLDSIGDGVGGRKTFFRSSRKIYEKPPLSVFTMFTKDDEHFLNDWMKTVPNWSQKIVIENVKITDSKKYIKNGLAPKPYEIRLEKDNKNVKAGYMFVPDKFDFDKARNAILKICDGNWILALDSDERLLSHQHSDFLEWLDKPENHINVGGYYVTNLSIVLGALDDKTKLASRIALPMCRLFRNDNNIYYDDEIHETVDRSINNTKLKIMDSVLIIHHVGYEIGADKLQEKCKRNIKSLWNNPQLSEKKEKFDYLMNTVELYKQLKG